MPQKRWALTAKGPARGCWPLFSVRTCLPGFPAGIPSRPNVAPRPLRNIAEFSVNALRTGHIRDVDFLKPYHGRPDVLYANPLVQAGDKVRRGGRWVTWLGAGRGSRSLGNRYQEGLESGRDAMAGCSPEPSRQKRPTKTYTPLTFAGPDQPRPPPRQSPPGTRRWCACRTGCPRGCVS
jgi:hypothetical protein